MGGGRASIKGGAYNRQNMVCPLCLFGKKHNVPVDQFVCKVHPSHDCLGINLQCWYNCYRTDMRVWTIEIVFLIVHSHKFV